MSTRYVDSNPPWQGGNEDEDDVEIDVEALAVQIESEREAEEGAAQAASELVDYQP
jgi:hypothetical protein